MKKFLISLSVVFMSFSAWADKPKCFSSSGGYCQYEGTIERIYVNDKGHILVYFDTEFDAGAWEVAGFDAKHTSAGIVNYKEKPEFGKMFYSTALSAQAQNKRVQLQMRKTLNGYMIIDRIWLTK